LRPATANCQVLVSTTLARDEVPVCIGLRLYLPEEWTRDLDRCCAAAVPLAVSAQPKWQIALDEIDRVRRAGVTFGCVLGDAEYGKAAAFRAGLVERGLTYAVGILSTQHVYPADVSLEPPPRRTRGGPPGKPVPAVESRSAADFIAALPEETFQRVSWRAGTKGAMGGDFAAVRVRVGPALRAGGHLPGAEVWLVCERRSNERKFHVTNHPAETPLIEVAAAIKARWVCEQGHQQMKEELGLDHCECRNWHALHHHALLTMIALCFLQHLRLREKNGPPVGRSRTTAPSNAAPDPPTPGSGAQAFRQTLPALSVPGLLPSSTVNQTDGIYLIQSIF
jgi:SRSO17 transposase